MGSLLSQVLPLAAGAAVSPAILTLQLLVLAKGSGAVRRAWFIAAGAALVLALEATAALSLAEGTGGPGTPPDWRSAVKLAAAVALLAMGIRNLVRRPAPKKDEPEGGIGPGRAFGLGVVLMVTNVTTLALYFPLVHEISTDDASLGAKAVVFAVASLIVMLPAAGPPLVVTVLGARADAGLKRMNTFVTAHHQVISAAVCFLFALVLGVPALRNLL
ncbi:MAG TPA: GAP family protein [Thermoleophilaceae bacterium]|nr:GAP family protein [Thermoleophilaceae bacterium]